MASSEPQSFWRCPQCQVECTAPAKFCSECGQALRPAQQGAGVAEAVGERRHITTMFCDMIGSTALSLRMDPEEYSHLIEAYRDICSRSIASGGGVINKFMGDGILACFGYPRSHEDDASRACRVGLQIIGSMQQALPTLKVRIAAATELVVSSDTFVIGAVEQHSIIGSTPNLAARLQERAPPGGMLIADEFACWSVRGSNSKISDCTISRASTIRCGRGKLSANGGSRVALPPVLGRKTIA